MPRACVRAYVKGTAATKPSMAESAERRKSSSAALARATWPSGSASRLLLSLLLSRTRAQTPRSAKPESSCAAAPATSDMLATHEAESAEEPADDEDENEEDEDEDEDEEADAKKDDGPTLPLTALPSAKENGAGPDDADADRLEGVAAAKSEKGSDSKTSRALRAWGRANRATTRMTGEKEKSRHRQHSDAFGCMRGGSQAASERSTAATQCLGTHTHTHCNSTPRHATPCHA
jgi:hypothetical protein